MSIRTVVCDLHDGSGATWTFPTEREAARFLKEHQREHPSARLDTERKLAPGEIPEDADG